MPLFYLVDSSSSKICLLLNQFLPSRQLQAPRLLYCNTTFYQDLSSPDHLLQMQLAPGPKTPLLQYHFSTQQSVLTPELLITVLCNATFLPSRQLLLQDLSSPEPVSTKQTAPGPKTPPLQCYCSTPQSVLMPILLECFNSLSQKQEQFSFKCLQWQFTQIFDFRL